MHKEAICNAVSYTHLYIETPDVVIKVNPERSDLIETRMIDGRQCLVIPVDDHIEINGIHVRTMKRPGSIERTQDTDPAEV